MSKTILKPIQPERVASVLLFESGEFALISDSRNRLEASWTDGIECPIRIHAMSEFLG